MLAPIRSYARLKNKTSNDIYHRYKRRVFFLISSTEIYYDDKINYVTSFAMWRLSSLPFL